MLLPSQTSSEHPQNMMCVCITDPAFPQPSFLEDQLCLLRYVALLLFLVCVTVCGFVCASLFDLLPCLAVSVSLPVPLSHRHGGRGFM